MWEATFKAAPPPSGEATERHFEITAAESSNWLWIEFASSGGDCWFGSFRSGRVASLQKIGTPDGQHFFVIAGGVCYCVDANSRSLKGALDGDFADLLPIPESRTVALAELNTVTIASPEGPLWISPRLAWDGIRFTRASKREVFGIAKTGYGPNDDSPFAIDLVTKAVTGGHFE